MIENRKNEWSELEAKAMEILENPRLLPKDAILKFYQPVLRVWIYPSFSPYKVWVFSNPDFKTIRPKNLKVIEVTWDKNEDYRRLNNPLEGLKKGFGTRPKLEIKSIEIESEVFESIYTELKQVQFSAFAARPVRRDTIACSGPLGPNISSSTLSST